MDNKYFVKDVLGARFKKIIINSYRAFIKGIY